MEVLEEEVLEEEVLEEEEEEEEEEEDNVWHASRLTLKGERMPKFK